MDYGMTGSSLIYFISSRSFLHLSISFHPVHSIVLLLLLLYFVLFGGEGVLFVETMETMVSIIAEFLYQSLFGEGVLFVETMETMVSIIAEFLYQSLLFYSLVTFVSTLPQSDMPQWPSGKASASSTAERFTFESRDCLTNVTASNGRGQLSS